MSEANKALVRRYVEEVGTQFKLDVIDEIFAPNFVNHLPTRNGDLVGTEKVRQFVIDRFEDVPDRQVTIEDMIAEGDRVVVRVTIRGTRKGDWNGIPADGKSTEMGEIMIFRIADGLLAERWNIADSWSLITQLGGKVVPA